MFVVDAFHAGRAIVAFRDLRHRLGRVGVGTRRNNNGGFGLRGFLDRLRLVRFGALTVSLGYDRRFGLRGFLGRLRLVRRDTLLRSLGDDNRGIHRRAFPLERFSRKASTLWRFCVCRSKARSGLFKSSTKRSLSPC